MGYFETLADNAFKEASDGTLLYYPNGVMSTARVVPDEETKEKLFKFQKRLYKSIFFFVIPYAFLVGLSGQLNLVLLSPFLVYFAFIILRQHFNVRSLARHDEKMSLKEAVSKGSMALPNWYYWVTGVLSVVGIALGVSFPFVIGGPFRETLFISLVLCSIGLLVLALSVKMYKLKNRENARGRTTPTN